tara:strand:- start:334 stop:930 length:597 start_codon:yes stop_codon:yes gene_type:complete
MIKFKNLCLEQPYLIFKEKYEETIKANQKNIEAICISSYSKRAKEVNARFVNLKFVQNKEFIFFSNYQSPKANDFRDHQQITATLYWSHTNIQIRIKANISMTKKYFNNNYFKDRDVHKNALAISSKQSNSIGSYDEVIKNYKKVLESEDLKKCPDYWGGFAFIPYYFEFWDGHKSRINKREVYEKKNNEWIHYILQP